MFHIMFLCAACWQSENGDDDDDDDDDDV